MKAESCSHWTAREFPVAFMCISHLLLHSKLLPNLQVLKQQPLFHPVSQSLESESTLVGWFWLKNFHKVVVKTSFGMQVISWLNQTGESFLKLLNMVAGKRQSVLTGSWPQALVLWHVDWTYTQHGSLLPPKWKIKSERLPKTGCLVKESIPTVGNIQTETMQPLSRMALNPGEI